ncbi:hypothetical protein H9P43_006685 [Blastocladiella emersonii ATCC 22665]|nr:hypothetical protein H9P43_006685 [Blastocladiella emersonii ATCC 22665]
MLPVLPRASRRRIHEIDTPPPIYSRRPSQGQSGGGMMVAARSDRNLPHATSFVDDPMRRVDDLFFAACNRDWELYAVGASLARFRESKKDREDWALLGRRDQFKRILAKGEPMSRTQLFRGLALPYDPCDALVGMACQSGRSFSVDAKLHKTDFFGFRRPTYAVVDSDPSPWVFSRVEAAQIFSVYAGPDLDQALPAQFPGNLVISLSRTAAQGLDLDPGHLFSTDDLALTLTWVDTDHITGADDAGEVCDSPALAHAKKTPLYRWATYAAHDADEEESARESDAELSSSSSSSRSKKRGGGRHRRNRSQSIDSQTYYSSDTPPTRDQSTRAAEYLRAITAPRARLHLPVAHVAKVTVVKERVGRAVMVLELTQPAVATRAWPNADRWLASPRVFVFGYFEELYSMLRRLVFLAPAVEGMLYRGNVEAFREIGYATAFPRGWSGAGEGEGLRPASGAAAAGPMPATLEELEVLPVQTLWEYAERAGIRHLVPAAADAFTIAEHLLVYCPKPSPPPPPELEPEPARSVTPPSPARCPSPPSLSEHLPAPRSVDVAPVPLPVATASASSPTEALPSPSPTEAPLASPADVQAAIVARSPSSTALWAPTASKPPVEAPAVIDDDMVKDPMKEYEEETVGEALFAFGPVDLSDAKFAAAMDSIRRGTSFERIGPSGMAVLSATVSDADDDGSDVSTLSSSRGSRSSLAAEDTGIQQPRAPTPTPAPKSVITLAAPPLGDAAAQQQQQASPNSRFPILYTTALRDVPDAKPVARPLTPFAREAQSESDDEDEDTSESEDGSAASDDVAVPVVATTVPVVAAPAVAKRLAAKPLIAKPVVAVPDLDLAEQFIRKSAQAEGETARALLVQAAVILLCGGYLTVQFMRYLLTADW